MGISNLFKTRRSVPKADQATVTIQNDDRRLEKETYVAYGTRICAKVTASLTAFSAYLPKVYNEEKQAQINDANVQINRQNQIQSQINTLNGEIAQKEVAINALDAQIETTKDRIRDYQQELSSAKAKNGEVNKMDKVKLIIGTVILVILTLYLFIFYSSTFYSAFFKEFDSDVTVGVAMFDAQAVSNSFARGVGQLLFILCAPIIFMGLGFGLHYFAMQKSWTKYFKMGAVVLITFVFDCILAYLIAEKIYEIQILTKLGEYPDFSFGMAIGDVNVWAVIFCGFIVYIIWGIVFDMAMTAYGDLRSNSHEILRFEQLIENENNNLDQTQATITQERQALAGLKAEVNNLDIALNQKVHYDYLRIRVALSDFHAGWMTMMNALSKGQNEQDQANNIFNQCIEDLFKETV